MRVPPLTPHPFPPPPGLPWIVPRIIKTRDTLPELESFFDKWLTYAGHAVIEPATTGCGQMPPQSPVPMAPPKRKPCRQLGRRLTVLSDATLALCDQDWQGSADLGKLSNATLVELWPGIRKTADLHEQDRFAQSPLCANCDQWHRP